MRIYGIDFTSAPRRAKPIWVAGGQATRDVLRLDSLHALPDFAAFEALLQTPGPWLAGFDFPFGQPRALLAALGWEALTWPQMVAQAGALSVDAWLALLKDFRDARPAGHKQPLRATDARLGALSPMMVYGVPVGRMFLRGAPRLAAAGLSIHPSAPADDPRQAIEIYPATVARAIVGKVPYKSERADDGARQAARHTLLEALTTRGYAGIRLALPDDIRATMLKNAPGDALDAGLAALVAAWAAHQPGYGIPPEADALEGWIVSPEAACGSVT